MNRKNPALKRLWDYLVIIAGCAVYAIAYHIFYQPNAISMGGFTGVSQIINRFIPALPVGTLTLVLNIPLLALGLKKMGLQILARTVFATTVGSLLIDVVALFGAAAPMDPLLASLYGGVLLGVSIGLLMKVSATTGGTELLARLLKFRLHHLSIGKLCMVCDIVVIILYALTFNNLNNALYGIVSMYVASIAMDTIVYGSINAKLAYIISDKSGEIAGKLLEMDLGLTLLEGRGAYTGGRKEVLMCAFKRSLIVPIKAAVTAIDPNAFVIVCEAKEVLGEGFGEFSEESL